MAGEDNEVVVPASQSSPSSEHDDMNETDALLSNSNDQEEPNIDTTTTSSTNQSNNDNNNDSTADSRRRLTIQRSLSLIASPLIDETGSTREVIVGLISLFIVGGCIGLILPKNPTLPTPWYRNVSAAIGYIYFLCWSVSFYPQMISNCKRRSTVGLSADFCGLNVLGFACYTIYNIMFFWNPTVQKLYRERYGSNSEITVQSNDVAFAIHAFILSSITFIQIGYYGGFRAQRPSKVILWILILLITLCITYPCLILLTSKQSSSNETPDLIEGIGSTVALTSSSSLPFFNWLDYLYLLSYIKILISLIKYVPQVVLNYQRKSTLGWSIWNIIFDFTGGMLSDLQLVFDCTDLKDFTGITGNLAKFGLGFVSIIFDIVFMIQHYILYPNNESDDLIDGNNPITEPLLPSIEPDEHRTEELTVDAGRLLIALTLLEVFGDV